MTNLFKSIAFLVCILIALTLASCGISEEELQATIDSAITEAKKPLNDTINKLNAEIAEVEAALDALETEKAALEESKTALEKDKTALEADKAELDGKIAELDGRLKELEGEKAALEEEKTALEADKAELDDKIAELNGKIAELDGRLEELEGEKTALESENTALETERDELRAELDKALALLNCNEGIHVWDGEGRIKYDWAHRLDGCTAYYVCASCGEFAREYTENITNLESGEPVANFETLPSDVYYAPIITGVRFNSDSDAYDAETNTFYVSVDAPFVLTFTGENLDSIGSEIVYDFALGYEGDWYMADTVSDHYGESINEDGTELNYIIDNERLLLMLDEFGEITQMGLIDNETDLFVETSEISVNLTMAPPPIDEDGNMVVSSFSQLKTAFMIGGKVKLASDITFEDELLAYADVELDLAGYKLIATDEFYLLHVYSDLFTITDSVGTSSVDYCIIETNGGIMKIKSNVKFDGGDFPSIMGYGNIDLSEYTGENLYIYASIMDGIILPEGYEFYDHTGKIISDYNAVKHTGSIWIKPDNTIYVSDAEELRVALDQGGNIELCANIETEMGFNVYSSDSAWLDLAGYDITITDSSNCSFWIHGDLEIYSDKDGSEINSLITVYGSLILSGNILFTEEGYFGINGTGAVDLTGYTGDELYIYVKDLSELNIPGGYTLYDQSGEMIDEFVLGEYGHVYLRPIVTEVATVEELVAAAEIGGYIKLTEDIDAGEEGLFFQNITTLDLNGKKITTSFWNGLNIYAEKMTIINGTLETTYGHGPVITNQSSSLVIDNCTLIGDNYYTLYFFEGVTNITNTTIYGSICVDGETSTAPVVYAYDNVEVIPEDFSEDAFVGGMCVTENGKIVLAYDPTDTLCPNYNDGTVINNGDGTFTITVQ